MSRFDEIHEKMGQLFQFSKTEPRSIRCAQSAVFGDGVNAAVLIKSTAAAEPKTGKREENSRPNDCQPVA